MFAVFSVFFGVVIGGTVGYYLIVTKKDSNEDILLELKTKLTATDSLPNPVGMSTWGSQGPNICTPFESETERLAKFKIKDTKDWFIDISGIDKEYLLTEYIKGNTNLAPYENVVGDREHLYPTMYFPIRLEQDGKLWHASNRRFGNYQFNISKDVLKKLSSSVNWGSYTLRLTGGPYRILDTITNEYTEFNDIPLRAYIEVPLKAFSAK